MEKHAVFGFNVCVFYPGEIENLKNLLRQDNNVIILRSFLNERDVEKFSRYGENLFAKNPGFPLLPKSFYNVHRLMQDKTDVTGYYSEVAEFTPHNEIYADLNQRVLDFFESCALTLMNKTDGVLGKIPPSTYRIIKKDFATIYSHCEKYLLNLYPFCKKVLTENNVDTNIHYSYFIQLQKPGKGGELVLLNTAWNGTKGKKDFQVDSLLNEDGIATDLNSIEKYQVELNPGDLLIFDGGNIWHAITPVESDDSRITFGGFINPGSNNQDSFFVWS